ncbi:hypothetical protein TraAM80_02354 [Trypanosoma rangeli]|uniref:Adenylyl cyclase n=1 Tax=Trypanosoma rangeli TaxID=5698 RepID=A0A3R7KSR2_TRYRA|nr:uncharacterized protein TraAM80_02354 [Trypanosoma rangeli]RNF08947.1 hypothetical protein TraAM80_02354 [Trypanosoma rangeli]|eukprot:RNF08947.1 hypothetical protein TraAM80_02354 [Trypanosoma rangeli]
MSLEEREASDVNCDMAVRLADLIIFRDQARRRIAELEATVEALEQTLSETRKSGSIPGAGMRRSLSAPLLDQPFKEDGLQLICSWNEELVDTVNELRGAMLKMETEAKIQIVSLKDEVDRLRLKSDSLRLENAALKERVADDVLRQRQTNRVEMAFEKAKIASRVRAAGLRRLECMEAVLMETHDDLYFVQRFDAARLPVRDVTFVIHVVANGSSPPLSGEEFTMTIYQNILLEAAKEYNGFHVCSSKHIEVFAFYGATAALHFSNECHIKVTNLTWPTRTIDIPFFAPVIDNGELLYSGPRMHTCMYTCNPGSETDPINGRSVYYGQEVRDVITAALQDAPLGEMVANKAWAIMICKETDIVNDVHDGVSLDISHIRSKLGAGWSIVALEHAAGDLFCSILPKSLERRRGLPPYYLNPSPRFPRSIIDVDVLRSELIASMKGLSRSSLSGIQQQQQTQQMLQSQLQPQSHQQQQHEGWVDGIYRHRQRGAEKGETHCADILSLYLLRQEKKSIIHLYKKLEAVAAFHEQMAMEAEDWYFARIQRIDSSETLYVCTVDIGSDDSWRAITKASMNLEEHYRLRDQLALSVRIKGRNNSGVHVNGNNVDVFTFAFRRPEHVLRFTAQLYAVVSQNCELLSKSNLCLMRAGVTVGQLRAMNSTQAATTSIDCGVAPMLRCRGKAVVRSGILCDVANSGEILVVSDVIQAFYATKSNLVNMEYNVLREGGRFLGSCTVLVDVYSILPKSYAFRRKLCKSGGEESVREELKYPRRSVKAALQLSERVMAREEVAQLLLQQQQLMERAEAARMAAEDGAWCLTAHQNLRLPWPVLKKFSVAHPTAELGFFFCDAADMPALSGAISDEVYKDIVAQYNHVVKEALLAYDGFIAKTDSVTAYIVIFNDPQRALEAALQIQRRLLTLNWPQKLMTLEATLFVRSLKTGIVLFNGVRARMVIHVSNDYQCNRKSHGEDGVLVDVFGPAMETVMEVASYACGGEILLTPGAMSGMVATLHGSLLMLQVAMQMAKTQPLSKMTLVSCVPRQVWERLDLFIPPTPNLENIRREFNSKSKHAKRVNKKTMWWQEENNSRWPLPHSRQVGCGKRQTALRSFIPASFQASWEDVALCFRRELSAALDLGVFREGFLAATSDLLMGLSNAFRALEDGFSKVQPVPQQAPTTPTAAEKRVDITSSDFGTRTSGMSVTLRSNTDLNKKSHCSSIGTPLMPLPVSLDPYKNALHILDSTLRGALHRMSRALGVGGGVHSMPQSNSVKGSTSLVSHGSAGFRKPLKPIQNIR